MATFQNKLKKYLEANSKTWDAEFNNFIIQNDSDGKGDYIKDWSVSGVAKPTDSQLDSYNNAANVQENLIDVQGTRKNLYGDIGDQLDLLYKDLIANKLDSTGEWAKKIKAVKDANPKG